MSLKQKFLKIKTYQEFDKRRNEFKNLNLQDTEISNHLKELFPSEKSMKKKMCRGDTEVAFYKKSK